MYQGTMGRLLNHSESCQVRNVASLLAEALSRSYQQLATVQLVRRNLREPPRAPSPLLEDPASLTSFHDPTSIVKSPASKPVERATQTFLRPEVVHHKARRGPGGLNWDLRGFRPYQPYVGSDAGRIRTRARRDGEAYVIKGEAVDRQCA